MQSFGQNTSGCSPRLFRGLKRTRDWAVSLADATADSSVSAVELRLLNPPVQGPQGAGTS